MRCMGKYTKIAVSSGLGAFTAYFFASRLGIENFAMKILAMGILTLAFQSLVLRFMDRGESPTD